MSKFWNFFRGLRARFRRRTNGRAALFLFNTRGREKQRFELTKGANTVRMYNCGPTVYDIQHIGNLSMYVFADVLRRVLEYNGYSVRQVVNITDVGHLTSDADEGEDRMTKGLRREKMKLTLENMLELGRRYTKIFQQDLLRLNISTSRITFPRASEYIQTQIAMVATLIEKGYAYKADDGVYFDTARFFNYGELGGITKQSEVASRIDAKASKRSPSDFALWKFDKRLGWSAPWGKGFPGWHIECSAMIRATLGQQIDIHTGGIEHIPIHHNNEIAQSEAVTGRKPLSRFWLHRAHIQLGGGKIAKSKGNVVYVSDVIERGFLPLSLRYLFLAAHYRTPSNFTWEALAAAQTAYLKLRQAATTRGSAAAIPVEYQRRISERFNDDLDTPGALAVLWEMIRDPALSAAGIKSGILDADRVLGLALDTEDSAADSAIAKQFGEKVPRENLPNEVKNKLRDRQGARLVKDWERADSIRAELEGLGYTLEDSGQDTVVYRRR